MLIPPATFKAPVVALVDVVVSVISKLPAIAVLPLAEATANLLFAISKLPSIPVAPVTSRVPCTVVLPALIFSYPLIVIFPVVFPVSSLH